MATDTLEDTPLPQTPAEAARQLPAIHQETHLHIGGIIRGTGLLFISLLAFLIFGTMAFLIRGLAPLSVDLTVTHDVQSIVVTPDLLGYHIPLFDEGMEAISLPGFVPYNVLMIIGILAVLLVLRRRMEALMTGVALGGAGVLVELVKNWFARPRPTVPFALVEHPIGGYSFPSGHVTSYVCLFGFLFYLAWSLMKPGWRRTAVLVVTGILIALVGVSRIYEGHHWASDVLGGYGLGFGWLCLCIWAYRSWEQWHLARLADRRQIATAQVGGAPAPPATPAAPA
jgi:membrane-associated phospholipid phosphatase